jgi:hypothetical protein
MTKAASVTHSNGTLSASGNREIRPTLLLGGIE